MKKDLLVILFAAFLGGWLLYGIYAIAYDQASFEISLYQWLSLVIMIVVSYYLAQRNNDMRKRCDVLDRLLENMKREYGELMDIFSDYYDSVECPNPRQYNGKQAWQRYLYIKKHREQCLGVIGHEIKSLNRQCAEKVSLLQEKIHDLSKLEEEVGSFQLPRTLAQLPGRTKIEDLLLMSTLICEEISLYLYK